MATGETKIPALPLDVDPTGGDYALSVDVDTGTSKKVPFAEISKALDKTKLLSTDADNLLTTGTDDNLRLDVNNDIVSADAGNILQKGTDGKLLAPSVALSLTEDRMFIGGASNTPEEKTDLEVREFLGLPTDYIRDDIQYVSSNQVSWQGVCRDSSDSRDFELGVATTASLVGAVANTTYNLFVAGNTLTDTPVVVWDIGSTPAGYTYYRRVLSIITDGVGSIINFTSLSNGKVLNLMFNSSISFGGIPVNTNNQLIKVPGVPDGFNIRPSFTLAYVNSDVPFPKYLYVGNGDDGSANNTLGYNRPFSHGLFPYITTIITNTSAQIYVRISDAGGVETYNLDSHGYEDIR